MRIIPIIAAKIQIFSKTNNNKNKGLSGLLTVLFDLSGFENMTDHFYLGQPHQKINSLYIKTIRFDQIYLIRTLDLQMIRAC